MIRLNAARYLAETRLFRRTRATGRGRSNKSARATQQSQPSRRGPRPRDRMIETITYNATSSARAPYFPPHGPGDFGHPGPSCGGRSTTSASALAAIFGRLGPGHHHGRDLGAGFATGSGGGSASAAIRLRWKPSGTSTSSCTTGAIASCSAIRPAFSELSNRDGMGRIPYEPSTYE